MSVLEIMSPLELTGCVSSSLVTAETLFFFPFAAEKLVFLGRGCGCRLRICIWLLVSGVKQEKA